MQEENPFKLIDTKVVYRNPWMSVREDAVIRPGGKAGIFGVVELGSGVTVVALSGDGKVYLVKEYRYAYEKYLIEGISGAMDSEEDALSAAKRELREEIGGESDEWTYLGCIAPWTMTVKGSSHLFLAKNVVLKHAQNTDEGEVIEVVQMPFNEAYEKAMRGEILHAPSVVAILKTNNLLNQ